MTNDAPLRKALLETIIGLEHILHEINDLSEIESISDSTNENHLRWMCSELREKIDIFPTDKISRWVGFIQGVLAAAGELDVMEERDRTRPLFHQAYYEMNIDIP